MKRPSTVRWLLPAHEILSKTYRRALFGLGLAMLMHASPAAAATMPLITVSIQPFGGVTSYRVPQPTLHREQLVTFGARAVAGLRVLAAEIEYSRAQGKEKYDGTITQVETTVDQARAGLRSYIDLGPFFAFHLRGGMQGTQVASEIVEKGVPYTIRNGREYDPYAGVGFALSLIPQFTISIDTVAAPSAKTYQGTLGLTFGF